MRNLLACLRSRAGVAAVEFAIIAPVLITLVGAAVDLGTGVERAIRLENAARAGAQYATRTPSDTAGARAAALATLSDWSNVTVTAGPMACTCPTSGASGGPVVGCGTTCPTGMARYITVTASRPFTPIFPTSALIPFNNLGTSTASVVARIL